MIGINLKINGLGITLGMPPNRDNFRNHDIVEPLESEKNFIPHFPEECIYWSKNCDILCFDGDIILKPNLNISDGADLMYGTSAYLYFTENFLGRVIFQLVGNAEIAKQFALKIIDYTINKIGNPTKQKDNITAWNRGMENFIAESNPNTEHTHFLWMVAPPTILDEL